MAVAVIDEAQGVELQRDRLLARLAVQRERIGQLWDWYRGRQPLPDVPGAYRQAYELMLSQSVTPWARLVVDAIAERLRVQGVRAEDHPDAAARAWDQFKRDRLEADQRLIYTDALISGTGYVSVAANNSTARIRPESAFEVTHEPDLSDRTLVAAAVKVYPLDFTYTIWICELYRPEATWRWLAQLSKAPDADQFPIDSSRRRHRQPVWEPLPALPNPHDVVPIVPFENRVNVVSGAASEIEDCVPILQRIDRLTLDMLVSSHYGSFRQKWATGLKVPRDENGNPVEPYKVAVNRLWVSENADSRFGSFEPTDLSNYLSAIDSQIAALAAISRVPAHYLMQRNLANPPTAESLISAETGLNSKVEDRHAQYGEAWEQTFYLQALFSGQPVDVEAFEVMWRPAEKRNPAQVADAAIKLKTIGVPARALWEYAGFSPQQVDEWALESDAATLLAAATAAPEPPALPRPQESSGSVQPS